MKRMLMLAATALLVLPGRIGGQSGPADHLELQEPILVGCRDHPYFRVVVNPKTVQGLSAGIALKQDANTFFKVVEAPGGQERRVVYVTASSSGVKGSKGNYILLLLDTSGSMRNEVTKNQSRFVAALAAIKNALPAFTEGTDYLSVAAFDSHDVIGRIDRATETVRPIGEVRAQIDRIATPKGTNDTALYSATVEALRVLNGRRDEGYAVALVVFSDGKNDVSDATHPRDPNDAGLLGDEGLEKVKQLTANLKVPVITVGFGITGTAVTAMQQMAWPDARNYRDAATNAGKLTDILYSTRQTLADQIQILFDAGRTARSDLAAQSLKFHVTTASPSSGLESRPDAGWSAPASVAPSFEATCTSDEAAAIDKLSPPPPPPILNRLLILFGFGALLAAMWFGAPRFMWPDRYVPRPQYQLPTAGSMVPPLDRPRMPSPSSYVPPAPSIQRPSSPGDQTVLIPPRGQPRPPATTPRNPPGASERPSRDVGDETVYMPPKNPRRDQ